jgi:hypothetical protein
MFTCQQSNIHIVQVYASKLMGITMLYMCNDSENWVDSAMKITRNFGRSNGVLLKTSIQMEDELFICT